MVEFDHVGLVAEDVDACAAWVAELLGGAVVAGPGHRFVVAGAARFAVTARAPGEAMVLPRAIHVGVRLPVSERARVEAVVAAYGVASEDVHGRLYVRDRDGNVLELRFG